MRVDKRRTARSCSLVAFLTLLLTLGAARSARADIIGFGDSLTDTGNFYIATGFTLPPSPPYAGGGFSNGPLWIAVLANQLGQPIPGPSLAGGTDFAFNGARVMGTSPYGTPDLATQVGMYLAGGGTPGTGDIFAVWGGANDLFFSLTGQVPPISPEDIASNLAGVVSTLIGAGAKEFVVPNVPPLGQTPFFNQTPFSPFFDAASQAYNLALATELNQLQLLHPEIQIHQIDVYGLFEAVIQNPGAYGLTNVTDASAGYDPLTGLATHAPVNPDTFLFFDGVHPTATAHYTVGAFAAQQVVPEPASVMLWLLLGTCGIVAYARRIGQVSRA